jgi:hypothetical protein
MPMKLAYANPDGDWHKDHPTGSLVFQYLLKGEDGAPDNFMFILARQDKDFSMPRHRHNFDQIRLPLNGDMNLGDGMVLKQGHVGYFPEGLPYGPQEDPLGAAKPGERLQLVLQFGGASGCGFMSMAQRKAAWAELEKDGHFEGPHYHRNDGKVQWGLGAVWEKALGERLTYPRPRYEHVIIADPARFNWLAIPGARGAWRKFLGCYTERRVSTEMIKLGESGQWRSTDAEARRLFYVTSGAGEVGGESIRAGAAIEVEAGEEAVFGAGAALEMFLIGLPPVAVVERDAEKFEVAELDL